MSGTVAREFAPTKIILHYTPGFSQHFYGKSFTITFDLENLRHHKMNVYGCEQWPLKRILKGLSY